MKKKPVLEAMTQEEGTPMRSKGGRPALYSSLVCSKKITLYLTLDELAKLQAHHAESRGTGKQSMNEFAKQLLFARKKRGSRVHRLGMKLDQLKKLDGFLIELKRINLNYNQSVKRLNQFHLSDDLYREFQQNIRLATTISELIEQTKLIYELIELSLSKD